MGTSTFSQETFDAICARVSAGDPLAPTLREYGIGRSTFYDWMAAMPHLTGQFARARSEGFDAIADSTLAIVDEQPPPSATGGTDSGYVQWQKARVETRLKLLAKWDPKRYGDKLDLNHSGEVRVNRVIFVGEGDGAD